MTYMNKKIFNIIKYSKKYLEFLFETKQQNKKMNVVAAIRNYVKKMTDESGSGMKILLLDQETVYLISSL
jgi:hypothetical protein